MLISDFIKISKYFKLKILQLFLFNIDNGTIKLND